MTGARAALFAGVLESHGRYDGAAEQVVASASQIRAPQIVELPGYDLIVIETLAGARVMVAVAHDTAAGKAHAVTFEGQSLRWSGPAARIDITAQTNTNGRVRQP